MIWGGGRTFLEAQFSAAIDAFYNLGVNAASDPKAVQFLAFVHAQGQNFALADIQYAEPVSDAPIFDEYKAIPAIQHTTMIRTLANMTQELNASNPDGFRETYWATTYKLNKDLATPIEKIFYEEIAPKVNATDFLPAITLQVITIPMLQQMQKNGGNPLGLSVSEGPYLLANSAMMWSDPTDDQSILQINSNIRKRSIAVAQSMGLAEEYIYMNYASEFEDVIASYGAQNKARLQQIAAKYDPTGVYQTLQPGYFKLNGSPKTSTP